MIFMLNGPQKCGSGPTTITSYRSTRSSWWCSHCLFSMSSPIPRYPASYSYKSWRCSDSTSRGHSVLSSEIYSESSYNPFCCAFLSLCWWLSTWQTSWCSTINRKYLSLHGGIMCLDGSGSLLFSSSIWVLL